MENLVAQINEVIDNIRYLMNSRTPVHPEQYTEEGLKLAILKQKLGEMKTDLKRKQLVAEKSAYARAQEQELNATQANAYIREQTTQERSLFELADIEHKVIGTIIDMVRSHASAIKEDK